MSRYFVSIYTDGPATRWNVIDRQTQEWVRRFPTKGAAEAYIVLLEKKQFADETVTICPSGWKTYTVTREQMDKLVGAAHSGGMLGGDAAYGACLTIGAILADIAFKEGFDKSPGSAPEDELPA